MFASGTPVQAVLFYPVWFRLCRLRQDVLEEALPNGDFGAWRKEVVDFSSPAIVRFTAINLEGSGGVHPIAFEKRRT